MLNRYFFTFGSDPGFPYQRGWVEVLAPDLPAAVAGFQRKFPDRHPGTVNCAFWYTEEQFLKKWAGVLGAYPEEKCHEVFYARPCDDPLWCSFERKVCQFAVNADGAFTCGAPSDDEMLCKA